MGSSSFESRWRRTKSWIPSWYFSKSILAGGTLFKPTSLKATMIRCRSFRASSPFSKDTRRSIPLKFTLALSTTGLFDLFVKKRSRVSLFPFLRSFKLTLTLLRPPLLHWERREQFLLKLSLSNFLCVNITITIKLGRFIAHRKIFPLRSKIP